MIADEVGRRWTRALDRLEAEAADPATPTDRRWEICAIIMVAADAPVTTPEALAILELAVRRPS